MSEQPEIEFSFKIFFVPFTSAKAIHFIILIGFLVYCNSLLNGFAIDDITYIVNYSLIHTIDIPSLFGKNLFNFDSQFRPIPAVYFAFLYSIFSTDAFYYHAMQIIFQITNTILVFLFFRRFFTTYLAFFTALVFLVHPMQVESVSYIASSDNPIFFLFGMSALLLSVKDTISRKRFCVIFILLLLSLLTKETGVLFMGMIVLYRFIFNRKQRIPFILFSVLTVLIYLAIRFGIAGIYFPQGRQDLLPVAPLFIRFFSIPLIFFYYIGTFFFPLTLAVSQEWMVTRVSVQYFFLPLIFDILFFSLLSLLGVYIMKRDSLKGKLYFFFFLWFTVGLLFHAQIFPLDMTVADRWFYFPVVGLLGLLVTSFDFFGKNVSKKTLKITYLLALVIILLLSLRTIVRNSNWRNNITLYTHDISVSDNYQLETSLGTEYYDEGNYPVALTHFKKSADFLQYGVNLANMGSTYEMTGDKEHAVDYFSKVIKKYGHEESYPFGAPVYLEDSYMGNSRISLLSGNYPRAKDTAIYGLKIFPSSAYLWALLAIAEYKQDDQKDALLAAGTALKLQPGQQTNQIYWGISHKQSLNIQFTANQN